MGLPTKQPCGICRVRENELPYPSLNEVNYLAFGESNDEYHNELYGFIESEGILNEFKQGKETVPYARMVRGERREEQKIRSEFIRHQIHHPENSLNDRFDDGQLQSSIAQMREFIKEQNT